MKTARHSIFVMLSAALFSVSLVSLVSLFSLFSSSAYCKSFATSVAAVTHVTLMNGDGTVTKDATILLRKGMVIAIMIGITGEQLSDLKDAQIINGTGKVLTPGLIETVTQVGLTEVGMESATNDYRYKGSPVTPAFRAAEAYNPHSTRVPLARSGGVTRAVISPRGSLLFGSGAWVNFSGSLTHSVDDLAAVAIFGGVGGHSKSAVGDARGAVWLRLREIFDDVRFYKNKHSAYNAGNSKPLTLSPTHLAAMLPVIERKIPLVLEIDRAADILAAVRFAKEQKIKLVISGGAESWMVAKELVAAKIPVILRPSVQAPESFDALHARDDAPALLDKAGVTLILSSNGWSNAVRRLRQEAGIAVSYGLSHAAAIKAITLTPAKVFGSKRTSSKSYGMIAIGKVADMVLWSGDPLELSTVVDKMWIDGMEQSLNTRQLELAKRYQTHR